MAAQNGFVTVSQTERWGDSNGVNGPQEHEAEKFTAPGTGTIEISEIGSWLCSTGGADDLCRFSIWTHDAVNNCPESMVTDSDTGNISLPDGTMAITKKVYVTKPQLTSGSVYWLVVKSDVGGGNMNHSRFMSGGNSMYYTEAASYPEWPTATDWEAHIDQGYSDAFYAVYQEVGGGATDKIRVLTSARWR